MFSPHFIHKNKERLYYSLENMNLRFAQRMKESYVDNKCGNQWVIIQTEDMSL